MSADKRNQYWHQKVVLVTGGSSGLGEVLCRKFLSAGASVVAVARNEDKLRAAASAWNAVAGRVLPVAADVTRPDEIASVLQTLQQQYGRLDAVVHAAGRSDRGRLTEVPVERLEDLWRINALAALLLARSSIELLDRHQGHLVLIGSLAGKTAAPYMGGYPASKFALTAIAHQLRLETDGSAVHILLVCPGPIARPDAGQRYDALAQGLPETARRPGGGVRLRGIDPERLAERILEACRRRKRELIVPSRARWLFAVQQLWPTAGDWLLRRFFS